MRIGQAIDEIFKDKSKVYTAIDVDCFRHTLKYDLEHRRVIMTGPFDYKYVSPLQEEFSELDWKLVKNPVTFMEAFKQYREGKTIEVSCDGMYNQIFKRNSNSGYLFHEEYIENGKWYIKEGN